MIQIVVQILILLLLLLAFPLLVGGLFDRAAGERRSLPFRWVSGQVLFWAGFQFICLPLILMERSFGLVVNVFLGYMLALALWAVVKARVDLRVKEAGLRGGPDSGIPRRERVSTPFEDGGRKKRPEALLLWGVFWGLLLFQLIQAVRLAYGETDDAYYLAVASATQSSNTMYQTNPYTGLGTTLDIRHSLAPFPIWIAFLARLSGMQTVLLAKTVLPVVLISMAYAVFYLLGREFFPEKGRQLALFMVFTQVLVLFGDYSIYTVENFMIARSRQGKAALGSIVIPFLLFLLLLLLKKLQEQQRVPAALYLLAGAAATTGCLCSALGALIICLAVGIIGLLGAVCYKRPRILPALALCCVPCVCCAALYLFCEWRGLGAQIF